MTATREGVVNPRQDALASIVKAREAEVLAEIKAGGESADLDRAPVQDDDPLRPETISREDWGSMSDEARAEAKRAADAEAKGEETVAGAEQAETVEAGAGAETVEGAAAEGVTEEEMVTIKVNGKEQRVPKSKVFDTGIRAMQKDLAADEKLAAASIKEKQAEDARKRYEALLSGQAQPPASEDPAKLNDKEVAEIKAAHKEGGEDAAVAITRKILAGRQEATQLNPGQIVQLVSDVMEAEAFKRDHADVWNDPFARSVFMDLEDKARAAGDKRPAAELRTEIAGYVRGRLGIKPKSVSTSAARQERKTTIVNLPSASVRKEGHKPAPEMNDSQRVAAIRKARGQE